MPLIPLFVSGDGSAAESFGYIDIGNPVLRAVGDRDVARLRLSKWLNGETISDVRALAEPGVASVVVDDPTVNATELTVNKEVTPAGEAVLVPYHVADGDVELARILLRIQSSNPDRRMENRAIPIRIVE